MTTTLTFTSKGMIDQADIKKFYDEIQFPGHYTSASLRYHDPDIRNPYLKIIDSAMPRASNILDVGCGTGLISNLFARRYRDKSFVGIDFADSVKYAAGFATENAITNARFIQQNFLDYTGSAQYDLIICQGVMHHIPQWQVAVDKIKSLLSPGGTAVIGVYHPWGKIAKKWIRLDYGNWILYRDQERNVYETVFDLDQVRNLFPDFDLVDHYPRKTGWKLKWSSLLNSKNGGLVTYVLQHRSDREPKNDVTFVDINK